MLVVLGHALRGLIDAGVATEPAWRTFDFVLYTVRMPLFMFLAGLHVQGSLQVGRPRFVRSKLLGTAYPYFVWSFIQGSIMLAMAQFTNSPIEWQRLGEVLWNPISQFWFLYALFVFMMAACLLSTRTLVALSMVLFLLAEFFPRNTFANQLLHFPLFFSMGVVVGGIRNPGVLRVSTSMAMTSLAVAAGTLTIAILSDFNNNDSAGMLPAAIGGGVFLIWFAQKVESVKWLAAVGRRSMPIFLMHILAAAGMRIVLQKVVQLPPIAPLYLAAGTIAGIVFPLMAYRALGALNLLPWLGVTIGPRGRRWVDSGRLSDTEKLA